MCAIIAMVNIVISIPLAKLYGGIGSAIGTSVSLIIGNIIIMNIYYQKKVGINVIKFWKQILKMLIVSFIPVLIMLILMCFIDLHGYIYLLVFGSIYVILYFAISYFVIMNNYEKNIVNKVIKKFKGKAIF